jgi:hypothetical protein
MTTSLGEFIWSQSYLKNLLRLVLGWLGCHRFSRHAVLAVDPPRQVEQLAPLAAERSPRGINGLLAAVGAERGRGRHFLDYSPEPGRP